MPDKFQQDAGPAPVAAPDAAVVRALDAAAPVVDAGVSAAIGDGGSAPKTPSVADAAPVTPTTP